jgi:hypothetical protein
MEIRASSTRLPITVRAAVSGIKAPMHSSGEGYAPVISKRGDDEPRREFYQPEAVGAFALITIKWRAAADNPSPTWKATRGLTAV